MFCPEKDKNCLDGLFFQFRAGVGKQLAVGQIRPADPFCPARGVVHVKSGLEFLFVKKVLARRVQYFFETARGPTKLPTTHLEYNLSKI